MTGTNMYDLFRLPKSKHVVAFCFAFLLCLASVQVAAQSVLNNSNSAFIGYLNTVQGTNAVTQFSPAASSYIQSLKATSPASTGPITGSYLASLGTGGNANFTTKVDVPIPGAVNKTMPALVTRSTPLAAVGTALGGFLKKVGPIGTALAFAELMTELRATWTKDANGNDQITHLIDKQIGTGCPSGPVGTACGAYGPSTGPGFWVQSPTNPNLCNGYLQCEGGTLLNINGYPKQPLYQLVPGTPFINTELEDAIASSSGWPTSMTRAISQGAELPMTGPTTATATETVTQGSQTQKTLPDGTVETTSTKITSKAQGDTIVHTQQTTTSNYNPTTNITNISSVSTSSPGVQETAPPFDICKEHPEILACAVPDLDSPPEPIPKATKEITYAEEASFGGGSCPADKSMYIRGQSITVWKWSEHCGMLANYVRPMMIMMATFIAMLIVAGVKVES